MIFYHVIGYIMLIGERDVISSEMQYIKTPREPVFEDAHWRTVASLLEKSAPENFQINSGLTVGQSCCLSHTRTERVDVYRSKTIETIK
jgi:hypothetical protein